jgi:NhaP-type Na+/H+ or K+/H+ antiporter
MRRLDVPRELISVIEGEGLFNDATALVAYRVAVAAVVAGTFSLAHATLRFVLAAIGGVAIGLAVGWLAGQIRKRIADTQVSVTVSLLTGYAAFIPADAIGASGVLAVVAAGLYVGIIAPDVLPVRVRVQGYYVWDILDFVVNATLFVLVGLQLRSVVDQLSGFSAGELLGWGLAIAAVVTATRLELHDALPDPVARPAARAATAPPARELAARIGVERHARRRVAGGRARDSRDDRRG